jgi:ATP-dependent protease HslVU (ClpYQ) peptidase subunit
MPKQKITTVYQFDELSDKAKERARDWYREGTCDDTYWRRLECESVIDDAATVAGFLGLDINQTDLQNHGGRNEV